MITIGLVQAGSLKEPSENLAKIKEYIKTAKEEGCQVLCFPECFLTGYYPEECQSLSLEKSHPLLKELSALALHSQMDLLTGFMEKEENRHYITQGIFKKDGSVDFYRKTHLGEKEEQYFTPGGALPVFSLPSGLRIGFQICVETHFPEITRTLSLRGAQVVFAPHAAVKAAGDRKKLWMKLIPARAYDNRVYMACCNQWDPHRFAGGCLVLDPSGEIIGEQFDDKEGLLLTDISPEEVALYHEENAGKRRRYYPSKVKKDLYE